MLWQNASARTVATATPACRGPRPARAACGSWSPPRAAGRTPRSRAHRSAPAAASFIASRSSGPRPGQHRRAAPAGRPARGRRRSGRRSAATSAENRASNPAGASATPRTRTSSGSTPLSRRSSASDGVSRRRAGAADEHVAVDVEVHHLAAGVHPGVRPAGAGDADRRRAAAPGPAPPRAAPGRSAAPAGWPSRGSRCRRRRGRFGAAPAYPPNRTSTASAHRGLPLGSRLMDIVIDAPRRPPYEQLRTPGRGAGRRRPAARGHPAGDGPGRCATTRGRGEHRRPGLPRARGRRGDRHPGPPRHVRQLRGARPREPAPAAAARVRLGTPPAARA